MTGHHVCRRAPLLLGIVAVWAGLAADAAGQGSTATDQTALEAIYRATGGDDWTDNTNWLSNAPLEDWYGVEVADGRVTGLRLGGWDETAREYVGNGLVGSLPPELGALSHLLWLEVGGNSGLTGPIPVELGNLGNLESLFLQENWLTDSIPAALGQLENLEWLALDRNALTGSIPADLGNLQYLRGLTFGGNTLSGPVPPELGNLSSLVDLYLGNTMLNGPLPASMSGLSALESLSLDESGLCVPDSPAMRAWVAGIADFRGAVCEGSASFSRVATQLDLGRIDLGAALLRRRPKGLLPAARQELLDPSKAWWGGRRGRLADRPRYSISVSLGVVPRWYSRVVEVPVRIEVAAGFVAPGASEPPRLQPSWPPGGFGPAHG